MAVATRLANADSRITLIRHATNKGHIATYNEGLALARSDYLVLLSADDLLTPGALARAAGLMDRHPDVGLVYGHPLVFRDDEPLPPARTGRFGTTIWSGRDWLEHMCRAGRNFIYCPEVVMRTAIQHRIGGYDPLLPHSGDMEMWMRAAAVSDIGRVTGADQAYYRLHRSSMQRTVYTSALFDLKARVAAFQSALDRSGLPDARRLERIALRSVAMLALHDVLRGLRCAVPEPQQVDAEAYCTFARDLDPDVVKSSEWGEIERLRKRQPIAVAVSAARLVQGLRSRLAFRYWRWRGLEWPMTRLTNISG